MGAERDNNVAFLDVETTGLDAEHDRIIEIAVIILKLGASSHDGICTLVNPGVELPPFIVEYTGITQEMLTQAPGPEVLHDALDIIGDHTIAAYNVAFDAGFVAAEARRLGRKFLNDQLCVMELTKQLHPNLRSYKLGDVCEAFDIQADEPARRALGDAMRAIHTKPNPFRLGFFSSVPPVLARFRVPVS